MPNHNTFGLPVALYRGGTSKALFFHADALPPPGPERDQLLKRVMGSPDPLQLDGMGGSKAVTSKIAIISKSQRDGVDVDYTFVQVGTADDSISYNGNCGNISAAVGPFAIDEGLAVFRPGCCSSIASDDNDGNVRTQEVRIYNTGTDKTIVAQVPVDAAGAFEPEGGIRIAGVPGTASPILMDYRSSIGAVLSKGILPTGNPVDTLNVGGKDVQITACDVANPCIFAKAHDFGITGCESAAGLTANQGWIASCQELRGKAAQLLGWTKDWTTWSEVSSFAPLPIFVAPPADLSAGHVSARLFLDKMCHESMAGTGAICTAACSRTPGTVVNQIVGEAVHSDTLDIVHPIGVMSVCVQTEDDLDSKGLPVFKTLSFVRTARRLMDGTVYVPKAFAPTQSTSIPSEPTPPPATQILAEFTSAVRYEQLDAPTKQTLKNLILDFIGVAAAATQKADSTGPVYETMSRLGPPGSSTVIGKGQKYSGHYAGMLNGFLGHSLDFDDTYADGSLHAGVTTISAGLAAAENVSASGEVFLAGLAVGYEVTCRIGRALGQAAYSRGFHNTATAGIFGAVATIARIKGLSSGVIEMAFGLAGSKAAGSMQYLENGSWNKRLHPGFAVHDAWMCVELAAAGVVGASKILEGKFGFFNAYSPAEIDYNPLLHSLGSEWVFRKTAWKPFPACRMTHGLITMTDDLREPSLVCKDVKSITAYIAPYQVPIVGAPTPNKIHPRNIVDAQFSVYYQVALAWLHGGYTGWAGYDLLENLELHSLADRIAVVPDPTLHKFQQKISVEFADGLVVTRDIQAKAGDDGAGECSTQQIGAKYLGLALPVYGAERAASIRDFVYDIEQYQVLELTGLVQ